MQSLHSVRERDVEEKLQEDADLAAQNKLSEIRVRKLILSYLPFKSIFLIISGITKVENNQRPYGRSGQRY